MRNLDMDADLVQAALDAGLIGAADKERVEELVAGSRGKLYGAQILVRERLITTGDLLTLQNTIRAGIYECPRCKQRHQEQDLRGKGESFDCKGCGAQVELEQTAGLSRIEVLTSRDPRDLTVSLKALSTSDSASEISNIDLDRYEVEDEIGRGGYGVVFKALHKDLERDVALKILRAGVNLPEIALERFIREGRSASRLKHPNIVSVYDIGRYRDLFALAMEFVPGESLKELLKRRGQLPWPEAVRLIDQVLAGLEHAHGEGIVHRDLKPTNIIIEAGTGRPRLIDFGLAKDLQSDSELTQAGAIVGTPFYLAPEQVEGRSAQADGRADIFAISVIFYELLAGKRPFLSRLKNEVYRLILACNPTPLSELIEDFPPALEVVIQKAMARKRKDRYQDVTTLRADLEPFLGEEATSETEVIAQPPSSTRKPKSNPRVKSKSDRRKRPRPATEASNSTAGLVSGLAVGAVVLIGVMVLFLAGGKKKTPEVTSRDSASAEVQPRVSSPSVRPTPRPTRSSPTTVVEPIEPSPTRTRPPIDPIEPVEPIEPSPSPSVAPSPSPSPTPAATPAPPPPVALDDGSEDEREFPTLAERNRREWLKRAFYINALAEDTPTARSIRALRLALRDRFPLNRAFALRGLLRFPTDMLRAYGSLALFNGLVEHVDVKQPYVLRAAHTLLARLSKDTTPRDKKAWKAWWTEAGEALFREAAKSPPPAKLSTADESKQAERLVTSARDTTRYFTSLRHRGLDLVFVMDVTKSMTDELARMRAQVTEITSFMELLLKGKVRMGFVTFGDQIVKKQRLTNKLGLFAREVQAIGIFDDPQDKSVEEALGLGLAEALHPKNPLGWRRRAFRTILVLGDAPPLKPDDCRKLAELAGKRGFTLNALIAKPPPQYAAKFPPHAIFKELATLGKGMAVELTTPEELITRILVFAFGSSKEHDLRRFVYAYREVTGAAEGKGSK